MFSKKSQLKETLQAMGPGPFQALGVPPAWLGSHRTMHLCCPLVGYFSGATGWAAANTPWLTRLGVLTVLQYSIPTILKQYPTSTTTVLHQYSISTPTLLQQHWHSTGWPTTLALQHYNLPYQLGIATVHQLYEPGYPHLTSPVPMPLPTDHQHAPFPVQMP